MSERMLKAFSKLLLLVSVTCCLGISLTSHARPERNCRWTLPIRMWELFWVDHWAEPLNTEHNGGPSSYETPSVKIAQDSCLFGVRIPRIEKIIPAGQVTSMRGYTYFAQICSDPGVCKNRCTYACCKPNAAGCTSCNESVECDQSVTSITTYGCENNKTDDGEWPEGKMLGICTYRSKLPSQIARELDFWRHFDRAWTVKQAQESSKELGIADCKNTIGFEQIEGAKEKDPGCFPVPVLPMPPPFGLGPMDPPPQQVSIYKICSEEDLDDSRRPVALLSSYMAKPPNPCVLPSQPEKYSTYSKPCVRVTFEKPQAADDSRLTSHSSGSFVDFAGTTYEKLYQFVLSINYGGEQPRIVEPITRNIAIKDDINDPNITFQWPTSYGYNDSPFIDLCANVNLDGTFTSDEGTLMDSRTRTNRKFKLAFNAEIVTADQVCVQENRPLDTVERGCVPRPNMKQPIVAFCEDSTINDQSNACMQIRLPDFQNEGYTYKFIGSPSKCTDKTTDENGVASEKPTCLINSTQDGQVNKFGFTAISTNDCYISMAYGLDSFNAANSEDLCMVQCEPCKFNNIPYECEPSCKFTNMYYDKDKKTITGVTKLCLFGYTDTYSVLTPGDCTSNCNRICAKLMPRTETSGQPPLPNVADTTSGARLNNQTPGVMDCCSCTPDQDPNSAQDRVKNPVEAGLCVDVYPFSFKDCQKFDHDGTRIPYICNIMQRFCGAGKIEQPEAEQSVVQEYKNFKDCIAVFKACSTVKDPGITIEKALPDGMAVPDDLLSEMSKVGLTMESMGCVLLNSYPFTGGCHRERGALVGFCKNQYTE